MKTPALVAAGVVSAHRCGSSGRPGFPLGKAGREAVVRDLGRSVISAVNWSEFLHKAMEKGIPTAGLQADLVALGLGVVPFTLEVAAAAASLSPRTRVLGLSLGDRACSALAVRLSVPAAAADREWAQADVGVDIRAVR